jgi:hypothetical protein
MSGFSGAVSIALLEEAAKSAEENGPKAHVGQSSTWGTSLFGNFTT